MLLDAAIVYKRQKVSHRTSNDAFSVFLMEWLMEFSRRQETARYNDDTDAACAHLPETKQKKNWISIRMSN